MDIENVWQQSGQVDNELKKLFNTGDFNKLQSRLPLKKLKQNILIGIICALPITLGYIIMFFFLPIWQVYLPLAVLIVFNSIIILDSWKLYKKTPSTISPSNSLKEELTLHYNSFQRWWSVQQKASLFVYPVAITGGFILGSSVGSGKTVEAILYNSKMLSILGITVIIIVLLCYFGAKLMFNHVYGKHLKKLESTINDLS